MEPRIQYCTTSDGVSIAYWTLGEGTPLVYMPNLPVSHVQLEWSNLAYRQLYEGLAARVKLVRYDGRGTGLSDREPADFSFEAQALDLEAVANQLGLQRFALFAPPNAGPAAIAYAARHSQRVSHLILWMAWTRASDWTGSPQFRALGGLVSRDWETYTETWAGIMTRWGPGEEARRWAALMRESITREGMHSWARAVRTFDVTDLLSQVRAPALVLHPRQSEVLDVGVARRLASRIPGARLVLLEGSSMLDEDQVQVILEAVTEFLGEGEARASPVAPGAGLVTVLFTDITDSTALTQRLGDAQAQELVRAHNTIVREALKAQGGAEIKHTGDGIMASFPTASGALECAIAIQRAVDAHNGGAGPGGLDPRPTTRDPLSVHVGLNAGEPVAEEEDLFGTAVQLARRICDQAEGGEILASDVVRQLAAGKGFLFADRGEVALRGFEDPVRLYEVRWRAEGSP